MKVAFLALVLLVAGCTSAPPTGPIESMSIDIVGQSILGPTYTKTLVLGQTTDGYLVNYRCTETDPRFGPICPCGHVEQHLGISAVESIVQVIDGLEDEGLNATCCDHPYATIEVRYADGSRKIILGNDKTQTLNPENLFSINC